jgi:hypothetical protein
MISNASAARATAPRRPLRASEPAAPFSRACLVALRWRKGNPYADRMGIRVSQRLAAGMPVAAVARAEGTDEAAIDRLLQRDGFAVLVESWRELTEMPAADYAAKMVRLARIAIENALADWDVGTACFVMREHGQGRDPAATLAARLARTTRPAAEAPPEPAPPTAAPPAASDPPARQRAYDPLDALVHRQTAALRRAVLAEHAAQATAGAVARPAAMVAPAHEALALARAAPAALPLLTELRHGLVAVAGSMDLIRAEAAPAALSPTRHARYPQAP